MNRKEILKARIKQYPSTEFKMYHYYLKIINFKTYKSKYNDNSYYIECKFNNLNPLTWLYKGYIFLKVFKKDIINKYKIEIEHMICSTYSVDLKKGK